MFDMSVSAGYSYESTKEIIALEGEEYGNDKSKGAGHKSWG